MKSMRWLKAAVPWVAVCILGLAGCAGHGELQGPASNGATSLKAARSHEATVVYFRDAGASERVPLLLANERVVGALLPSRYAFARVCAGDAMVGVADRAQVVGTPAYQPLKTVPGQVAYLRVTEPAPSRFELVPVPAEEAQRIVAGLKVQSHIINRHVPDCEPKAVAPVVLPPVITEPAVPIVMERIQLGADALFRFDGRRLADLLPAGRATLDQLAETVKGQGLAVERLRITGHTDRLGSSAYNQQLSIDRARTVADYLGMKGLQRPTEVLGAGEHEPVTTGCQGNKATPKLVACLQPDRRVVIELIGLAKKP